MKQKIYFSGCGGMLGEAFYEQYKDDYIIKCTDKDVNINWLTYLDFRDHSAYKKDVFDFNPDYLFHLGAYTDCQAAGGGCSHVLENRMSIAFRCQQDFSAD